MYSNNIFIQRDDKCESFTWWEKRSPNPELCVHNYFDTKIKRNIADQSTELRYHYEVPGYTPGKLIYTSGPKFCTTNLPVIDNERD